MIDPNILLAAKTPLEHAQEVQSLQNARNLSQIQGQQLQADQLANQQTQRQQAGMQALNQAIAQNVTKGEDGQPTINHDAVAMQLAKSGFGEEAEKYKAHVVSLDDSIGKLQDQHLKQVATMHDMANQAFGAVLQAPPQQKQAVWTQAVNQAVGQKLVKPGEYPAQVPDDGTIQTMLYSSLDATQQINAEQQKRAAGIAQQRADAQDKRADAAEARAEAYQQSVTNAQDSKRYTATGDYDKDRHPIVLDTRTGALTVDKSVTGSAESVGGKGGKGTRELTPDASLANQSKNQTDYEKNASSELGARQQRDALDQAIANGSVYVDAKGAVKPFSSMKTAGGDPLSQSDIDAMKGEMRQRRSVAETAVEQAVANKNNAMQRNGVRPTVSTDQAIAQYRGQGGGQGNQAAPTPQTAKTPAAAVAEGTIIRNARGVRMQLVNGAWKPLPTT